MTRVVDDRGRLFGKVNIVDILVLLVILAVVVFAAVRLAGADSVSATVPVQVSFLNKAVDRALLEGLPSEGTVRDSAGNVIGELQSVEVTPTVQEMLTGDGQYKTFSSSTHSDVTFVVMCQGTVLDSSAHIGGLTARVGADVRIVAPGYEAQTVISRVVWGSDALQ